MRISELLIAELDEEAKKTRAMFERVPAEKADFLPHPKSMTLGGLAPHVAELAGFGHSVVTASSLDFGDRTYEPLPLESPEQLIRVFDDGVARVRRALEDLPDSAWSETWRLSFKGQLLFEGTRFLAYRHLFLNHVVHHRAQLGTYLRLNDVPLPPTYGPSADDRLGL